MGWCVAQVKPQRESWALENLERQGFRGFMPLLREHRGKHIFTKVMFPNYLFVEVPVGEESDWKTINYTRGVTRVLASSMERPSYIPTGFVENLIALGGIIDQFETCISFNRGDQLVFLQGPFMGQAGICQWSSEKRVALLLSVLGRETMVVSDPSHLKLFAVDAELSKPLGLR